MHLNFSLAGDTTMHVSQKTFAPLFSIRFINAGCLFFMAREVHIHVSFFTFFPSSRRASFFKLRNAAVWAAESYQVRLAGFVNLFICFSSIVIFSEGNSYFPASVLLRERGTVPQNLKLPLQLPGISVHLLSGRIQVKNRTLSPIISPTIYPRAP